MKMKWGEAGGCGRLRQAAATELWLGEHGLRTSRAGKRLHRQRHGLEAACCSSRGTVVAQRQQRSRIARAVSKKKGPSLTP
jgi:hypothetical protein